MPKEEEDQGSDDDAQLEDEMEEEIKEEEPEEEMKEEDPEVPEQPEAERTVNPDQMETLPLDEKLFPWTRCVWTHTGVWNRKCHIAKKS